MFKLRRRTAAATTGSDLPFCSMCGQNIRVDAASGRCALGHRVLAVSTFAPVVDADQTAAFEVAEDPTVALEAIAETSFATEQLPVFEDDRSSGYAGEGLYEAYQSADAAAGHTVTWDDVVAPSDSGIVYDDYVAWDEPTSGFSSLDVDPDALPVSGDESDYAPADQHDTPLNELLDELDDAASARRKAVGTIGATIAVSSAVFAGLALLV